MSLNPELSPYERIGGDKVVRQLVFRFYELMDSQSETQHIRAMHPDDLSLSGDKLYKFLSGWLGGPQRYVEEYGHPRLRARHLPFQISQAESDAWMLCMNTALDELDDVDELLINHLRQSLRKLASHMHNQ